jgi:hypothetical protein
VLKLGTQSEGQIMKKFALSLVIAAVAIFGSGVAAHASTYPPLVGTVSAPLEVLPGGIFTVAITGCASGEVTTSVFEGESKTAICVEAASKNGFAALVVATGTGTASTTFKAPSAPGNYVITVIGDAGFRGSTSTSVAAAPATPVGGLPATGTDGISTITMMAIGFFAVGGGLLVVSQLRRRQIVAA